jgi:hypothetical protein
MSNIVIKPERISSGTPLVEFTGSLNGTSKITVGPYGGLEFALDYPGQEFSFVGGPISIESLSIDENLIVGGDLTVNGTMATVNTVNLEVKDAVIGLGFASGTVSITPAGDRGFIGSLNANDHVAFLWKDAASEFTLGRTQQSATGSLPVALTSYSNLHVANVQANIVTASLGFSGSLTKLVGGEDYLRCGKNISTTTGALGQVEIVANPGNVAYGVQYNENGYFTANANFKFTPNVTGGLNKAIISGRLERGFINSATGEYSHAEGYNTTADGGASHSEGQLTRTQGWYSHAEGENTLAAGQGSHTEGYFTTSSSGASYSHAEGYLTFANSSYAHAEGQYTKASGIGSHAEGYYATASANYAHAEGYYTVAFGQGSHAAGQYTIASGSGQAVVGKYNKRNNVDSLFIVGNGDDDVNARRSDIFLVNTGSVLVGSASLADDTFFYVGTKGAATNARFDGNMVVSGTFDVKNGSSNSVLSVNGSNVGVGTSSPSYKLEVNGDFAATTKSFVIDHPSKSGWKLRHGSLEGPENGVYVRGKANDSEILLPSYWKDLVLEDSITVQITPIGKTQSFFVSSISLDKIVLQFEPNGTTTPEYFYFVQAERKDAALVVEYEEV